MGRVDELGFNLGCFNLPFLRVYMDSPQPGMESEKQINDEEVKSVIEVMAASGKYWHDWDKLKGMLSFHLKQVLSDYPEAKMTIEQQQSCLGESLPELAKRLDDAHGRSCRIFLPDLDGEEDTSLFQALNSFAEGPPFTLQRLCEILLDARNIYSKLSKLALALEKNLLVTSTLTISSDPYTIQNAVTEAGTETETETETKGSPVESNGVEPITSAGDADEVMAEVEEAEVEDVMTVDMDTIEAIVRSSEAADTTPTSDS
ncbi:hypothetical protein MTR67_012861 [Solanum verrucosum]|uniref:Serine/threonine-protein phosphatase 4 regulatory subunit 2 n=1 Tax=Solanum verrucosum TaxID=315347 RepID=A0AAF0THE7_SOLVR|nr:hypothetical protein MTR67_012861 [Solanum verrucosum]